MESEVMQPPLAPALVHGRKMRNAWIALGVYICIRIFYAAWFEWRAYKYGVINFNILEFLGGFLYLSAIIASFVASVRLAFKRAFIPALMYAFIAITPFVHTGHSFVMEMKARIFAAYPNLCQTPIVQGQRVSRCYGYNVNDIGGESERIYFNPGDELSLPPKQWPDDIKYEFFSVVDGFGVRQVPADFSKDLPEYALCGVRNTKRIVDHVYWISDDCWKH
jgi:hypothetical protein